MASCQAAAAAGARRAPGSAANAAMNLAALGARARLVAVVGVLVGSTAFDSFQDSLPWVRFSQGLGVDDVLLGEDCGRAHSTPVRATSPSTDCGVRTNSKCG